ncbi:hypothetical protein HOD29_05315 [archaeon]|jgi:DNA polymerase II small subunit|nr:hypothetical protein [archaeon]
MQEEILRFCSEKNVLLERDLLILFSEIDNLEAIKSLINQIEVVMSKKFINKNLIENNKDKINHILDKISISHNLDLNKIKQKIGIREFEEKKEEIIINDESKVKIVSSFPCIGKKLEVKDFVVHFRKRYDDMKNIMQERSELENLVSINKIPEDKQKFSVIGMITNKRVSKKGNLLFEIEDLTGKMKVVINSEKKELMDEAEDVTLDGVIGFSGFGNREILFVNKIIFPDTRVEERKKGPIEEYALFIGDIHYGSKNFLEKDFLKFINYLNNPKNPDVLKIKYLFIIGDIITGIGNYPNQEQDLKVGDLEEQFSNIAGLLGKIRKDIKIIISPGNHDCVRIMEPQPLLDEKYAWPLYEVPNIIITENPSLVNIGEYKDFPGFNILCYHGFSFPYYANTIPKLMIEKSMNEPEKIMKYLLKNRHLAPTHASTQYFPLEKDGLLIRKAPDIFVSGHTHKSGVVHYNNVLIISSSSWEGMTPYQEKFGNKPDHCKVPMFNLKTRAIKILDFESGEDGIKTYVEENE